MAIIPNLQGAMHASVYNSCRPPEGSLFVPITIPFTPAAQTQEAHLEQLQATAHISYFQSLYVRNVNAVALDIIASGSLQTITVPANWAGYVALLAPNPVKITFVSLVAAPTDVVVALCNFPVNTFLWPLEPTGSALNPIIVSDPVLDALLASGYLPVLPSLIGYGDVPVPSQTGTRTLNGVKTATGSTTILTPTNFYQITGITCGLSGDAALAAPGVLTIDFRENTTVFETLRPYLPGAAGTPAVPTALVLQDRPFEYWSRVSGQTLTINFSAALTAGTFWYCFNYLETATGGP